MHRQLGLPIASTAPLGKISDGFTEGIRRFARDRGVPMVDFVRGQRKDDVMHEHLASFTAEEVGMGGRRSPLRDCPVLDRFAGTPGEAATMLARLRTVTGPVVLLIDDVESFDDADGAISTLFAADMPGLHVVTAGNNDALRPLYSHWTKAVRRSKVGVLLRPNIDLDRDMLGAILPRRARCR